MEKRFLDRRLAVLEAEGVVFQAGVNVGVDLPVARLRGDFDAVLLAGGAGQPRDLPVPGRDLAGIYFAMDYLTLQNRRNEGDNVPEAEFITAKDKNVIIIGGGDTGADCLGTAHRQGARSVHQLELMPMPPRERAASNPWPEWPQIFRVSTAHEEGGERLYSVSTQRFSGGADGRVRALHAAKVELVKENGRIEFRAVAGSEFEIPADLVLLAMGFTGPQKGALLSDLGVTYTSRGNVARDERWMTNVPGVFTAGDMQRGQSLIVWAIAEGRSAARAIDVHLMGESRLPAPLQ
jgi:glutamate synthase (NADPH/NADH) small chain